MFFVALSIATVTRQIEFSHFDVTVRLQFQESCDNFGQLRRIVVMHHVAGVIDGHAKVMAPAFAHFGDPLFHSQRRVGKIHARWPNAFDEDELTHALWKRSGIEKGNGSAHQVADELKLRYTEGSNHAFEIEDVIGKMIVAAGADPPTIALTATVGSDDPSRFSQLFL